MGKFYGAVYKVLSGLVRRLYRVEIIGAENEPERGPFIVCANHISNHDVVILAACLKHQVRYLAKAELFRIPLLSQLIKAFGAYPLKRGQGDVGALKKTIKLLEDGEVVGFFPQGHRYPGVHPNTTRPQPGIGLITVRSQATVLPVAICAKKYRMHLFRKTRIIIGKPIEYSEYLPLENNKTDYDKISERIFGDICALTEQNERQAEKIN